MKKYTLRLTMKPVLTGNMDEGNLLMIWPKTMKQELKCDQKYHLSVNCKFFSTKNSFFGKIPEFFRQ